MEQYRYIIAIALTLAVILGWNQLQIALGIIPEEPAISQTEIAENATSPAAPVIAPADGAQPLPAAQADGEAPLLSAAPELPLGKGISVTTPLYQADFNSTGGILTSFTLAQYAKTLTDKNPFPIVSSIAAPAAPMGLLLNESPTWKIGNWSSQSQNLNLSGEESGNLQFVWEYSGIKLTRTLTFHADSYLIDEVVHIENLSGQALSFTLGYSMKTGDLVGDGGDGHNFNKLACLTSDNKFDFEQDEDDLLLGIQKDSVRWGSVQSNFFMAAVIPGTPSAFKGLFNDGVYGITLNGPKLTLPSNAPVETSVQYFLGPKVRKDLEAAPADLKSAMDYGWFWFIAEPMIIFLTWIYQYIGNYGVAIIILTIIIKIAMWPLSRKSYKSMEKMRQLQPMIKKIQDKYKDDRQKASQETMQLYKTYKINPAGGCMPLLLQIPVFIGLYQGLLNAVELRHAPFISHLPFTDITWLADLSSRDPFYITPIVMGVCMFIQQKMSPPMGDPTQAKIMLFMPVVFTVLFAGFPSGLVVYWLVNLLFSLAQQYWTMRNTNKNDKKGSGTDSGKGASKNKNADVPA
ncbi:MAG: membrane protein insertase YidC [Desulfovibrionaceae bacterium]|nr:membrane protein insertase YidC [Desulfovibrionaceae bacterium]